MYATPSRANPFTVLISVLPYCTKLDALGTFWCVRMLHSTASTSSSVVAVTVCTGAGLKSTSKSNDCDPGRFGEEKHDAGRLFDCTRMRVTPETDLHVTHILRAYVHIPPEYVPGQAADVNPEHDTLDPACVSMLVSAAVVLVHVFLNCAATAKQSERLVVTAPALPNNTTADNMRSPWAIVLDIGM